MMHIQNDMMTVLIFFGIRIERYITKQALMGGSLDSEK